MTQIIPINTIDAGRIDDYLRGERHAAKIAGMVKAMREGVALPPIWVFPVGEKRYLAGGHHRLRAHQVAGRAEIAAELIHCDSLKMALALARSRRPFGWP